MNNNLNNNNRIFHGDSMEVLKTLPRKSIDMCFTCPNPPFFRMNDDNPDYVVGREPDTLSYIHHLVLIFQEVKEVLKDTGSLFVNLGDYLYNTGTYMGTPELFMLKMMNPGGWYLRSKLIWYRTETDTIQPEKNRFRRDWEYIMFFTKKPDGYYFNSRDNTLYRQSIFGFPYWGPRHGMFESGFPEELIEIAIRTTVPKGGTVLDCFAGTGTVGLVAKKMKRKFVMIDSSQYMYEGMKKRLL
jgi:site-specific DNA-methyltransferase (adenine-specific)